MSHKGHRSQGGREEQKLAHIPINIAYVCEYIPVSFVSTFHHSWHQYL